MKRLLLVDDSRTVRSVCRSMLAGFDFDLTEAENGARALEIIQMQPKFDAVLLDWNMPIMDGLAFLKSLKREPEEKRPIVIMCTIKNDMEHISLAIQEGASEYIMKPFDETVLEDKLQEAGVL